MLSIKDVEKRYKDNPEPIEVTKGRQYILDSFKDIIFEEKEHRYFLPQSDGSKKELSSVSAMIKRFEPYVDWDEKAEKKALKLGIPVEELKEEWKYSNHLATTSGSVAHEYAEMLGHFVEGHPELINDRFSIQYEEGYLFPASPKQEAALKLHENLFAIHDVYPVMEETRVYDESLGYSGTFDKLVYFKHPYDDSKSGYLILDWKTNASLSNDYCRSTDTRMLPPFDDMINEPLSHYTVQLSAYQIPLENIGLKVLARRIIWLKSDGTYEKISLPDVTKKIREALK